MTKTRLTTTIAVALLVVSLMFVASAAAETATRTVPSGCIDQNTEFTVTINSPGTGGVVETLCSGWTYTGSSLDASQVSYVGDVVTFTLVGDTSFTYTVKAPDTPDMCCTISGFFRDMDAIDHPISDDTVCTCPEEAETATRTVPSGCIDQNTEFTVTINSPGTGGVVETLCSGWTYTGSSLDASQVSYVGDVVTFTLVGDTSFTYTVKAPDTPDMCCTISGFFRDMDAIDHPISDDTVCTCVPTDTDPQPDITTPTHGTTIDGTVTVSANDLSGEGDIEYCRFEYAGTPSGPSGVICNDTDGTDGWSCDWDTTTVPDGNYQIRATMGDTAGQTGTDQIMVHVYNPCACDYCLDLVAGWNFVSVPKVLDDSPRDSVDVFNLSLIDGEICLYYDCTSQGWDSNYDVIVKQCQGYWVYKNTTETICLDFDTTASPNSETLCIGWNMIGHVALMDLPIYTAGSDADFGSITGLEDPEDTKLYRSIYQWTPAGGWKGYPTGGLTHVTDGQAYWILMKESATMYGQP